jgi:hypothetical protein
MNLWGNGGPNHLVSFGVRSLNQFVCSWCVLRELFTFPSSFSFDSSFLARFDSFLLHGFDQWRELNVFTEGNHLIPHEITDRDESRARVRFWGFFGFLWFPLTRIKLGDDLLGVAYKPCDKTSSKISSQSKVIWSSFGLVFRSCRKLLSDIGRVRCQYRTTFEFRAQICWRPPLWCLEAMVKISWFLDTFC